MHLTTRELSVNLWSEPTPAHESAHERLLAQIHTIAPGAQITPGVDKSQLCIVLSDTDMSTFDALDALSRNDFREAVFSYRWLIKEATLA